MRFFFFNLCLCLALNCGLLFPRSILQNASADIDGHGFHRTGNADGAVDVSIGKYGLFEKSFVSSTPYVQPFLDVTLSVRVNGPQGESFEVDGYWYEGKTWKVRIMPFSVGRWTYETESNEPSLDGITGHFDCLASSHPGILHVSTSRPYTFQLSGGHPFFWMGETCWKLFSDKANFTDGSFQDYLTRRKEQKFSAIHFLFGIEENVKNEGGFLWNSKPQEQLNPEFFKWADKRFSFLDSLGMVTGIFITWSQSFASHSKQQFERFERYLIARYGAYPLIYWIIAGEFDEAGSISDYRYHGQVINQQDPYDHPISIHPDQSDTQNIGSNRIFRNDDWLSFIVHQYPSFGLGEHTPQELYDFTLTDRQYGKPVVNAEFYYEGHNYHGQIIHPNKIRKIAWAIVMGGGFPTYGHTNIIFADDLSNTETPGAQYMTLLYTFFEGVDWWKFDPTPERVNNGYCLGRSTGECIVYLPSGGEVTVDLTGYEGPFGAEWYDPKTGNRSAAQTAFGGSEPSYTSPFNGDAALQLRPTSEPIITLSADTLFFSGVAGEGWGVPQDVTVSNSGGGSLSWTAGEDPDCGWIVILEKEGNAGDVLKVVIHTGSLAAGVYGSGIKVEDPGALNSPQSVWIMATISPPAPPVLSVEEDTLRFRAFEGESNPSSQFIRVMNEGASPLNWTAVKLSGGSWLVLSGVNGTDDDSLETGIHIQGLSAGTYEGKIRISDPAATNTPVDIVISLIIDPSVPLLHVAPSELAFDSTAVERSFVIRNAGRDTLDWTLLANPPQFWILSAEPDSGAVPLGDSVSVLVTIDRTLLIPGDYAGLVTVISNGGNADVLITATATGSPELFLPVDSLHFYISCDSLSFSVQNTGDGNLSWQITTNPLISWITVSPSNGFLTPSSSGVVSVKVDRTHLIDGYYATDMYLNSNDISVNIRVHMIVSENPSYSRRVNCGSNTTYIDGLGRAWLPDQSYVDPGWGHTGGFTRITTDPVANTTDDTLFGSQRWGMEGYRFDCPNGEYEVSLRFVETVMLGEGKRIFHVLAEEETIFPDLDIFEQSGGRFHALEKVCMVRVDDAQLNIDFQKVVENPTISGIAIRSGSVDDTTRVPLIDGGVSPPGEFNLHPNFPNPFNVSTRLIVEIPYRVHVRLTIYNTRGQRIRGLLDAEISAGRYELFWDGREDGGGYAESGIYIAALRMVAKMCIQKMTLIK